MDTDTQACSAQAFYPKLRAMVNNYVQRNARSGEFGQAAINSLLFLPDLFALLLGMLTDKNVPPSVKQHIWIVLAYIILPVDILADMFPVVGLLDDAAIAASAIHALLMMFGDRAFLQRHWAGDRRVIEYLPSIAAAAQKALPPDVIRKILKYVHNWVGSLRR